MEATFIEYGVTKGARIVRASDAQTVGEALAEIAGNPFFDGLTRETLADATKPEAHPLHDIIWNMTADEALQQQAWQRAEELIRSVQVLKVKIERGWDESIPPEEVEYRIIEQRVTEFSPLEGRHVALGRILSDRELRAERVERLLGDLESLLHRMEPFVELDALRAAVRRPLLKVRRHQQTQVA
jgi:hypothetical protein